MFFPDPPKKVQPISQTPEKQTSLLYRIPLTNITQQTIIDPVLLNLRRSMADSQERILRNGRVTWTVCLGVFLLFTLAVFAADLAIQAKYPLKSDYYCIHKTELSKYQLIFLDHL
jgi:hypothetical protein